ncbi:putative plant lipid transfer protein/Par allergen [Lupinus albus]|uniref:Putative plant lipid transfer protein/Par allergen n=1 Tax=Lupinus albus TaxID=3870 RepID=A0A6A4QDN0_LUPAL|nr:putative plant lipid transfer protein/Par allergen [Lupinus albus]
MKKVCVAYLTFLAILVLTIESGQSSFEFDDALNQLLPCVKFVTGLGGNTPSDECCNGVRTVASSITTTDDKRAACTFLQSTSAASPLLKTDKVTSLINQCGPSLAFVIAKDVNCETII